MTTSNTRVVPFSIPSTLEPATGCDLPDLPRDWSDPEPLRSFADAAAEYQQASIWRWLSTVDTVQVDAPVAPGGFRFVEFGRDTTISIDRDLDAQWSGKHDMFLPGGEIGSLFGPRTLLSLFFVREDRTPPTYRALWDAGALPIGGERIPWPLHIEEPGPPPPGGDRDPERGRRPSADELTYITGLLRTLAATTIDDLDQGRWTIPIETPTGVVRYTLSLPDVIDPPSPCTWADRGFPTDPRRTERVMLGIARTLTMDPDRAAGLDPSGLVEQSMRGETIDTSVFAPPATPADVAQELCYDAFDTQGWRRNILARRAIAVSEDCADAYVILADQCVDDAEAIALLGEGMDAGLRATDALNTATRVARADRWCHVEWRSYLIARYWFAKSLEREGHADDAITHYLALIELDPGDNLGVWSAVIETLVRDGRHDEARALLNRHRPPGEYTAYAHAFLEHHCSGDSRRARNRLRKALFANPYVAGLVPSDILEFVPETPSEFDGAVCAHRLQPLAAMMPDVMAWLEARTDVEFTRPARGSRVPRARRRRSR